MSMKLCELCFCYGVRHLYQRLDVYPHLTLHTRIIHLSDPSLQLKYYMPKIRAGTAKRLYAMVPLRVAVLFGGAFDMGQG